MGKIAGMFAGFFVGGGAALTVIVLLVVMMKSAFGDSVSVRVSPRVIPDRPAESSVYRVNVYGGTYPECSHCEFREEMEQHDNFWEHLRATEGDQPWIDKLQEDLE